MGLTIEDMGIYDAPVFDSFGRWALANGVAHHPQTSLPWSQSAQRNVYLAGHRMGFRGTWSRMIFYNLHKLDTGDEVLLRDRAGRLLQIPRKRGFHSRSEGRVGDGAGEGEGHGDVADMHPLPHLREASDSASRSRIDHSLPQYERNRVEI